MLRPTTLLMLVALSAAAAFGQAGTCGVKCGQERWAIKTLTDSDAASVGDAVPQNSTVTALIGKTAPAKLTDTRVPLEKQRFHLTVLIIGWKIEEATSAENLGWEQSWCRHQPAGGSRRRCRKGRGRIEVGMVFPGQLVRQKE